MSTEDPESYLRRFAEAQLRRLAAGEVTAADCASRVDAVAAAFEETGVLDGSLADDIAADLDVALAARSPERGTLLHTGRRTQISALRGRGVVAGRAHGTPTPGNPPGEASVVPAGLVMRTRANGAEEDIYLLSYVCTPGRSWIAVAARTTEPRIPRRHASPPSARNPRIQSSAPRPSTFAGGGMCAVDDAGRKYDLGFSGGGGEWYLGRLSISPVPPAGIAWLRVHCGDQSVCLDLRAAPPHAEVTVRPLASGPGEAYLMRRAEALLGYAGTHSGRVKAMATGLASAVPALRAVGLLPDDSPVPGQVAALAERIGAPGRLIAEPATIPERWAAAMTAGTGPPADVAGPSAAHLAIVLPETDGTEIHLAGLVTLPGEGTIVFGGIRARSQSHSESMWLRDDAAGWHRVSVQGWSSSGSARTFQAAVEPPVGPETSRVEFYATGANTEVRADIPLTWWTS